MQRIIQEAYRYASYSLGEGAPADYIPELAKADTGRLAVSITDLAGRTHSVGDSQIRFTMQSISKVVLLAAALHFSGFDGVFARVGVEPTGDPFNSIVRLETGSSNRPSNPMINAGAIAVTTCIPGDGPAQRFERVLEYARSLLDNPELDFDREVYRSESETGDRNRALAYMMRADHAITGSVPEHLEVYFKACSLLVNCEEISFLGAVLANNGVSPRSGRMLIEPFHVKVIRSLMCTCGMYDASGEFALRVGIPAKSGVGGGIMGAVPNRMGIGTYCPALDSKGNSLCGLRAMEYLSQALNLSLF
ncbi:MAG: glutaminase A [Oscillospiraceae bacterium]|nr:MAG: glutaminase A [Oscillospiraceae bacterium]